MNLRKIIPLAILFSAQVAVAQTNTPTITPTVTPTPTPINTPACSNRRVLPMDAGIKCVSMEIATATPNATPIPLIDESSDSANAAMLVDVFINTSAAATCTIRSASGGIKFPYSFAGADREIDRQHKCMAAGEEVSVVRESGSGTCSFYVCYYYAAPRQNR